jgi:putative exosortase-associated protein (TIGR04073 family)
MRAAIATVVAVALCTLACAADEAETGLTNRFGLPVYPAKLDMGRGLVRGFANVTTCWLEMPREMVVEINRYPVFGLATGLLKGAFYTSARAGLGVIDLFFLGLTGPSAYTPAIMPEYVWNARWSPYRPPTPEEATIKRLLDRGYYRYDYETMKEELPEEYRGGLTIPEE